MQRRRHVRHTARTTYRHADRGTHHRCLGNIHRAGRACRKLLVSPDYFFRFNVRSLYNYSLEETIKAGAEMVDRMAMTRNEWRSWVGLTPHEGMDELLALENYIPADRLGDQKKLNGGGE